MSPRTAWRWCAAAGVVAFLCSWAFGRIPGLVACGSTGGLGPILAFEFVTSPADVAALFGGEPCRSTLIAAQRTGLLLDGLGFIPAYVAFLVLAALACAPAKAGVQSRAARHWAPAFAEERLVPSLVIIAGLLDEIEGGLLSTILTDLPDKHGLIDALWWAVHGKFALLAAGTLGIAALLIRTRHPVAMLPGVLIGVGAIKAGYGLAVGPAGMMSGFAIAWVTILLSACAGAWRPSLFSGSAGPPPDRVSPSA